jgi:hypothetical protein
MAEHVLIALVSVGAADDTGTTPVETDGDSSTLASVVDSIAVTSPATLVWPAKGGGGTTKFEVTAQGRGGGACS